jgi:UDP-N-acetylmuramoylalanine--D-glutamate ligase
MIAISQMTKTVKRKEKQRPVDLSGMRILVVGLARTGMAVARFLTDRGARVTGLDSRGREVLEKESPELQQLEMDFYDLNREHKVLARADLIVLSPGVPPDIEPLVRLRQRNIPIVSEIELASWYLRTPIIAVTGTNGKTTTTLLISQMLQKGGKQVSVGGNIGNPMINLVDQTEKRDMVVVELSSFQLEAIREFRPFVGVLLNITEDHLDRYPTFDAYVEAKSRIFLNQNGSDLAVLNAADTCVKRAAKACKARRIYFNVTNKTTDGAFFNGRHIVVRGSHGVEIYDPKKSRLFGIHNVENMMAAIVTARFCGSPQEVVQEIIETFDGLDHRLEFVGEVEGIRYFNDSKGTNVGAVMRSLEAFSGPVILIAGGKDKGGDYSPLRTPIGERVKHLVLTGEAKTRMSRELGGVVPLTLTDSLRAAVEKAHALARRGDTVLLSPACSSYDMFRDYVERGNTFKTLVQGLTHGDENRQAVR